MIRRPLPEPPIWESGGLVLAAGVAAAGTAYAANRQKKAAAQAAKAAGQPVESKWESTDTRTGWGPVQDDLTFAADEARRLYDAGPVLRGGGGGGGKGKKGGGGDSFGGYTAEQLKADPGLAGKLGAGAKAKWDSFMAGGGTKGAKKPASMETQNRQVAQKIIDTGLAGSPNQQAADDYLGRVYEEGGLGGNEVYQDLNERYAGASLDDSSDLIKKFLGEKYGGEGAPAGGGGGQGGRNVRYGYASNASGGAATSQAPGGGMITDQTAGSGLFSDWAKDALSGGILDPNDPDLKAYLDLQQREGQEELDAALQDVGDEFEGVGMYGGSGLALERALTRSKGQQAIGDERTKALMGYRGQGLDYMGNAASLVNQRDIAGSSLASEERMNRENARASAGASGAALDAQLQIANRGLDLEAIQSFLQNQQFGLGELGKIGAGVSADRMAGFDALGAAEDLRYGGLGKAYGVSGDLAAKDAAKRARREALRFENAQAPGRHLDEYLNRLGFFNSAGGTTTSKGSGTNVDPGRGAGYQYGGPSPGEAAIAAGLGTYFAGQANRGSAAPPPVPKNRNSRAKDPTGEPWL